MGETVLLVPVPEAALAVDRHRLHHTRAGADGLPPHVTLLYPFTAGRALDRCRLRRVAEIVAAVPAFGVTFREMRRFAHAPPILYLHPEPSDPFAALTAGLVEAFPEHPPYGGIHEALVPHLTVAIAESGTLDAVEADALQRLPIHADVTVALLLERGADGRWVRRESFRLG